MAVTNNPHKQALINLANEVMIKAEPKDALTIRDAIMKYEQMDDSKLADTTKLLYTVMFVSEVKTASLTAKEVMKNASK